MKNLKMLMSLILSLSLCLTVLPFGVAVSAEDTATETLYTIFEAEPALAGDVGANVTKPPYSYTGTPNPISIGVDKTKGYYFTTTFAGKNGWTFADTGIDYKNQKTANFAWMADTKVLNILAQYMSISYDYRCTTEDTDFVAPNMYLYASDPARYDARMIASAYPMTVDGEWHSMTYAIKDWTSTSSWERGWLGLQCSGSTNYPSSYTVDVCDFKIQISSKNKDAINEALAAAEITDITFDTITSYEEYVFDPASLDTNVYPIYEANAGRAGVEGADVSKVFDNFVSQNGIPNSVYVGFDEEDGYYYTTTFEGKNGWIFADTGIDYATNKGPANFAWMASTKVLEILAPYMKITYEYRCTTDDTDFVAPQMYLYAADPNSFKAAWIGTAYPMTVDGDWHTVTYTVKESWNGTETWDRGWIAMQCSGSTNYPSSYTVDLRGFTISLAGSNKTKINDALTAAGITDITFDTIIDFEPYVYPKIDTPIWYANPDRSVNAAGGTDVSVNSLTGNDDIAMPSTGFATNVYTDTEAGETFYRTLIEFEENGSGGNDYGTFILSGFNAEKAGFGWMGNLDVLKVLQKYMYISYEYRFTGTDVPSNAQIYMRAANDTEFSPLYTNKSIVANDDNWTTVSPTLVNGFDYDWEDGYLYFSIYAWEEQFTGVQTIDLSNIKIEIPSNFREDINAALADVEGIDEIENFTLGVELADDANGNKDYFSLLSMTEKSVKNDLNDDDVFNIIDLVRIKKFDAFIINYIPDHIMDRADSDSDGYLDGVDIVAMRKALLNK